MQPRQRPKILRISNEQRSRATPRQHLQRLLSLLPPWTPAVLAVPRTPHVCLAASTMQAVGGVASGYLTACCFRVCRWQSIAVLLQAG